MLNAGTSLEQPRDSAKHLANFYADSWSSFDQKGEKNLRYTMARLVLRHEDRVILFQLMI